MTSLSADINVVQDLQAIAGPLINAWVAAFNAVGFFQHKSAAAPAPAQHL